MIADPTSGKRLSGCHHRSRLLTLPVDADATRPGEEL